MIIVLTGVTGSGKSDLAISLAKKLNACIINADAFQVYRELSIATAKPTPEMMMEAPHYLFDFVPLDSSYDVAEYQADLRATLAECAVREQNVIIAGGTGLYIRAGLFDYEFPEEAHYDMSAYEGLSNEDLYAKLKECDPESAASIHLNNRRRVLRALEIYLATGKRKSEIISSQTHKPLYDVRFFGLEKERGDIYERVNARVDQMMALGMLEETKRLVERYGRSCSAFQAIGVKEFFPYFDGEKTLEECVEDVKKATRNYVKRQETFFRHQFPIIWIKNEEDLLNKLDSSLARFA